MSTPTPEPTLGDVLAALQVVTERIQDLESEVSELPARILSTQVTGLADGTKTARPLRGLLAVLNNRGAETRNAQAALGGQVATLAAQVTELARVVDGGKP